ncbi:glycosyltransferase family 4 protein [Metallosphaera javensis (ex Sakai et al. 2022)]|uniref:glycosyltransferase family 4 protein n=1 Tax=Metallosphaera javensis (ex Sakai et al. 2022) TaxID=2775498 RepID=UPI002586365E|nr:MAG: D-inositol-3-phosphate glycosyltransferase [Metallosphaera javensis (ex Sakai et al. 2022)]
MKIIVLFRLFWTSGASKIAIEEVRALSRLGHDVRLVFLRETSSGKYLEPLLRGIDYEIFSTKPPKWIYSTITGLFAPDRKGEGAVDYDLLKSFAKTVKPGDADLMICHDQLSGISGYRAWKSSGIPYVVYVHEKVTGKYKVPILGWYARRLEYTILKNAKKVFAGTPKIANSIISTYGIQATANFPGVELKDSKPYKSRDNMILTSAVWDRGRNVMVYLKLMERLENIKLLMVGRWRDKRLLQDFQNEIVNKNLEDRMELITGIPEDRLQELYSRAKFIIRFGWGEWGPGMVTIEAISHLTPLIINSDLGISDLIKENGGGLVLNEINYNDIVKFVQNNNNEKNYSALQDQLRRIASNYTWETHAKILIS